MGTWCSLCHISTSVNRRIAKELFYKISHGKGKNLGRNKSVNKNSVRELFYKISHGKGKNLDKKRYMLTKKLQWTIFTKYITRKEKTWRDIDNCCAVLFSYYNWNCYICAILLCHCLCRPPLHRRKDILLCTCWYVGQYVGFQN